MDGLAINRLPKEIPWPFAVAMDHSRMQPGEQGMVRSSVTSWDVMVWIVRPGIAAVVFCLLVPGCGGSRYPESRFHPIAIPEQVPAALRDTLEQLNSPDPLVRAYAARQLAAWSDARDAVVPCLLAALKDDNAMVRAAAAASLGPLGDREAVKPLSKLLGDVQEDRDVRSRAAESLGQLRAEEAVPALIAALDDTVWHVRLHAVDALGCIGDPQTRSALENTARYDPNFSVRDAAHDALQQMGQPATQSS